MSIFVAVDPGVVRTGVAVFSYDNGPVGPEQLLTYKEVYGGLQGAMEWLDVEVPSYITHFVVEDYQVHRTAGDPNGLRVIGAIEMWAYLNGRKPVYLKPAAGRKQIMSDATLKRLGWYLPGEPLRNAREAVRWGAIWLKQQKDPYVLEKGYVNG